MSLDVDDLAHLPPPAAPPMSAELAALLGDLQPAPTRRPGRQLAILAAASLAYAFALLLVVRIRRDLAEIPTSWMLALGAAWLAGFLGTAYLALVPARGAVMPRWRAAAIAGAVLAVAFVVFGLAAPYPAGPSSLQYGWPRFPHGHTCLEIGLATALVPVVLGALALRGALPVGARWAAAGLGAAAGCLGGLVLHVHCCVTDNPHIGLVHGGVVVIAAALSAWLVPRRVT